MSILVWRDPVCLCYLAIYFYSMLHQKAESGEDGGEGCYSLSNRLNKKNQSIILLKG